MSQNTVAIIHVTPAEGAEQSIEMRDRQALKMGRAESNDLVLNDYGASRMHASISASYNGVAIADMSSTNGTFVNGERIESLHNLNNGDIIDIGGTKIRVEVTADEVTNSLSSNFASRAMTAELKPISVTVCVITAENFHKLAQEISPNEMSQMLERWRGSIQNTAEEYGGVVDKAIGPSNILLWREGEAKKNALKATHAALQIRDLTESLSKRDDWGYHEKHPWKSACVLSSGLGLQGVLGTKGEHKGKSFAMLGDPINTAFQLEKMLGKLGTNFVIDQDTAKYLEGSFDVKKVIQVKLKGSEKPVSTFTIAG